MKSVEIPSSVVEIGKYAFAECENLHSVSIPAPVAKIGAYAFAWCLKITKINLPETLTKINDGTFYNCRILRYVEIPAQVESIGAYAYAGCPYIDKFTFKGNVKSFGQRAFYYDEDTERYFTHISELDIPDYNAWSKATFNSHLSNPIRVANTLKREGEVITALDIDVPGDTISAYAFYGANITDLKLNAKSIGSYAFYDCSNLKRIAFATTPDYIGKNAFYGVYAANTEIPSANEWCLVEFYDNKSNPISISESFTINGMTPKHLVIDIDGHQVSDYAFYGAKQLESIKVKASAIGSYAFYDCSNLKRIAFATTPDYIGKNAFYGVYAANTEIPSANEWCLVEFYDNKSNPISISESFTINGMTPKHLVIDIDGHQVSDYAFYGAKQLESIKVKASAIGNRSFYNASGVKNLYLDVDSLGSYALSGAQALERIYVPRETPPTATDDVFSKYKKVELYVPAGAVSTYEGAETCWWRFLDVYESDFSDLTSIFGADYSDNPIIGAVESVTRDDAKYEIQTDGEFVTLKGAEDADVYIYSISGALIYSGRGCYNVRLAPGIYVVKADRFTTKFIMR